MCKCNLCEMISRIEDIGRVREKLECLLDEECLDQKYLSKHNEYWKSDKTDIAEKLDDQRRFLLGLTERLWEIMEILNRTEEDG